MVGNLGPVLIVEDDTVDAMTIMRAFSDLKIEKSLVHMTNGEEALEYLKDKSNKKPCIILLDLNMPKMNGLELLKIVKSDEALKRIPVVVLTISSEQQDKVETFKLGVAGYVIKPVDYENFVEAIGTIDMYWNFSEIPNVK